jgi:hypothetical protein
MHDDCTFSCFSCTIFACIYPQILECLDLLLQLLEGRKYDQLFALLFEPEQAEMLYKLLTYKGHSIIFYEKVVKVSHSFVILSKNNNSSTNLMSFLSMVVRNCVTS